MIVVSEERSWSFSMASAVSLANSSSSLLLNSNLSAHQAAMAASVLAAAIEPDHVQLPEPYKVFAGS